MNENGVRAMLAAKIQKAGKAEDLAREWEISGQYIRDVANQRVAPGRLILKHLGLEKVVSYRAREGKS